MLFYFNKGKKNANHHLYSLVIYIYLNVKGVLLLSIHKNQLIII